MKTPFYRLYEFDLGGGQHLFVPRPQNLGKHHYTLKGKGERLDFRISVGTIQVEGRQLGQLLEDVAQNNLELISVGEHGVTDITFADQDRRSELD